jgi:hypothetical protein
MLMPSIEVEVRSSLLADVSFMPLCFPPPPESRSQSTWSRSSAQRTPWEESMVSSIVVVDTSLTRSRDLEPRFTTSRPTYPSWSPLASLLTCVLPLLDKLSPSLSFPIVSCALGWLTTLEGQQMPGNPLEEGNKVYDIIRDVRVRKGLVPEIPGMDKFYDKL